MNIEHILQELCERAMPVDAEAALAEAGPDCLEDRQLRELIAGGQASEETLRRLATHVPHCQRCWSLVALLVGEGPMIDESGVERAVDRAAAKYLVGLPEAQQESVARRVMAIVMQWLPGLEQPQFALAPAWRAEGTANSARLTVTDDELPLEVTFNTPEGVPVGAIVVVSDQDGQEVLRASVSDTGTVIFPGPAGTYELRVDQYDGPLLIDGDD